MLLCIIIKSNFEQAIQNNNYHYIFRRNEEHFRSMFKLFGETNHLQIFNDD